jgi:heptosyltransferase-2
MSEKLFKVDCKFFNGYTPCAEHKENSTSCGECKVYSPIAHRTLVIKTGAAGDVIRTTPILRRIRHEIGSTHITWITGFPDLVPSEGVDRKLLFNWENSLSLMGQKFDLVINLDKSTAEAALAGRVKADQKWGFLMDDQGKIIPANSRAVGKWQTGIDDASMKNNKKHFVEETFEICGWDYQGETYWLNGNPEASFALPFSGPVIGLNTGCGERWLTRLWPEKSFQELALKLKGDGYGVLLLGGPDEHEKNLRLAKATGAYYAGVQPLLTFVDLVKACDVVLTSVTMALHIAIASEKRIVLLNNIFPTNEFHLYDLGEILEPGLSCQSCYKGSFDSKCLAPHCMGLISTDQVYAALKRQLPKSLKVTGTNSKTGTDSK